MGAFVIALREGFEASLIVGLMFACLARSGDLQRHAAAVWQGVAAAVAGGVLVGAVLFVTAGELEGRSEAIFEGIAMLTACVVLTWMVFWMRRQARTIGGELRRQVGLAITRGGGIALASVAFVAVGREAIETALFLFVSVGDSGLVETVVGGTLGLALAVGLGVALYRGTARLDLRRFFQVTGVLVIALAAYLLYGGLHELGEAGAGEALEVLAPLAGVAFAATFLWMYLRGVRAAAPAASAS